MQKCIRANLIATHIIHIIFNFKPFFIIPMNLRNVCILEVYFHNVYALFNLRHHNKFLNFKTVTH